MWLEKEINLQTQVTAIIFMEHNWGMIGKILEHCYKITGITNKVFMEYSKTDHELSI